MPAIQIADLNYAKTDVDHIADIANSAELTATDRLGRTKPTIEGLRQLYPNAEPAATAASTSAAAAAGSASAAAGSAAAAAASAAAAAGSGGAFRNKIINGNFLINQRQVSPASTVYGATWYAMDRWQAGAGGCTMSFATTGNVTTVTITAGTLTQVIEGANLRSGTYVLSWTGTAQGRINGGAYGASGAVTASVTGGSNVTVEFGVGTLSFVQFERNSAATSFEERLYPAELAMCQRYYRSLGQIKAYLTPSFSTVLKLPFNTQPMRAAPTVTLGTLSSSTNASNIFLTVAADGAAYWTWDASAGGVSLWVIDRVFLSAEL